MQKSCEKAAYKAGYGKFAPVVVGYVSGVAAGKGRRLRAKN